MTSYHFKIQTPVGNGIVVAGDTDFGLGDLQLVDMANASATNLGSFGLTAADGLDVGGMAMLGGKLYLGCVDRATENSTATGLYTLPAAAASQLATTDATLTADATAGGTAAVQDWRGSAAGTLDVRGGDTATWTARADSDHAFAGWYDAAGNLVSADASYTAAAAADTVLTARFVAAADTTYTVRHFKQQPDGAYAAAPDETDSLTGTAGAQTAATAKSYAGFTVQAFDQTTIAADGSTVVNIKYARNVYTVAFDANGGMGTMSNETMSYGVARELFANAFVRDGYTFVSWNTKADGTGTAYSDKVSVEDLTAEDGAMVTLYARWTSDAAPVPASLEPTDAVDGLDAAAATAKTGDAAALWALGLGALMAAAGTAAVAIRRRREL
jgi:uncharacterized repeat protein (TIGR02543 family)/LPXTG-motif cell wall-anchored protein